ncbi:FtsK/SpoIIIE domain-containing protein [Streptococcus suis]
MKPSGVVDDQIWSNSRFKLALKVADRSDSMEMLKTPDAAEITQVGRGYLQVGNNEVYELFQSAWSGADYQPDKDEQGIEDHTIYAINDIGQYEILNEDLSGLDQAESIKEVPSELQAIVSKLKALAERLSIQALPQPWLPPLSKEIFLQDLRPQGFKDLWGQASGLVARLGMVDIPSRQSQEVLEHDFEKDGHIALFSSPGMGKSTFLQSLVMDLARQLTPEDIHFYLLDFGTNGLLPLKNLPHVADYIMLDELEKLQKLSKLVLEEIRSRKKLFGRQSVANAQMYRQVSNQSLPTILFILDNYDGLKGTPVEVVIDNLLQVVAREGTSLGIYLSMTAARFGTLRATLSANIKQRLSLKLNDDAESRTIVGRTNLTIEDIPGRGLVSMEQPEVFQVALPTFGEVEVNILENLKTESREMSQHFTGPLPKGIPVVPENLTLAQFINTGDTKAALAKNQLPIGIEFENVQTVSLPLDRLKHLMLFVEKEIPKLLLVKHCLNMLAETVDKSQVTFIDSLDEYTEESGQFGEYYHSESDYNSLISEWKESVMQARRHRENLDKYIVISDLSSFITATGLSDNDFAMLYEEGQKVGFHLIYTVSKAFMTISSPLTRYLKGKVDTALIAMKLGTQTVFTRSHTGAESELASDEIYLHYKDAQTKLKITKGEHIE